MIKNLLRAFTTTITVLAATTSFVFAQVDVNKADAAALDGVKGVGASMSKAILEERGKGEFKDWADLQKRVKGMGDKKAAKLSEAGLQVNGKGKEGAAMAAKTDKPAKGTAKGAAKDASATPAEGKASM